VSSQHPAASHEGLRNDPWPPAATAHLPNSIANIPVPQIRCHCDGHWVNANTDDPPTDKPTFLPRIARSSTIRKIVTQDGMVRLPDGLMAGAANVTAPTPGSGARACRNACPRTPRDAECMGED